MAPRVLTLALVALTALGGGACGGDDDLSAESGGPVDASVDEASVEGESIEVTDAWARSSPPGVSDGAAYLTIESAEGDQLVGALVPTNIAAAVEMHETVAGDDGAAMTMQQVSAVELPAGEAVRFEPGGLHVMLRDLAAPLESGSSLKLTLIFASSAPTSVTVDIRDEAP